MKRRDRAEMMMVKVIKAQKMDNGYQQPQDINDTQTPSPREHPEKHHQLG